MPRQPTRQPEPVLRPATLERLKDKNISIIRARSPPSLKAGSYRRGHRDPRLASPAAGRFQGVTNVHKPPRNHRPVPSPALFTPPISSQACEPGTEPQPGPPPSPDGNILLGKGQFNYPVLLFHDNTGTRCSDTESAVRANSKSRLELPGEGSCLPRWPARQRWG